MSNQNWHDFAADLLCEDDPFCPRYYTEFDAQAFATLTGVELEADPEGGSDLKILRIRWQGDALLILAGEGEAAALRCWAEDAEAAGQLARWVPLSAHDLGRWALRVADAYRALPRGWSTVGER